MKKIINRNYFENKYWRKYDHLVGIDEVGRGSWAGPIVVAGCIFPKWYTNNELKDSKKLSIKKRKDLFECIKKDALGYHIVFIDASEVDKLNPKQASIKGMKMVFDQILPKPDFALIDGETINTLENKSLSIIEGDNKSISIAAASILAKVTRDNYMVSIDKKYLGYDFAKHKGYGTLLHLQNLKNKGPIRNFHRFSYRPIQNILHYIKERN